MLAILKLLRMLKKLWDIPPVEDEAAFRAWLGTLAELAAELANLSPTTVDDKLVALLRQVIGDDNMWAAVYGLLLSLLGGEGEKVGDADVESRVKALALPGIDPASLVMLILSIVRLIREWLK